MTPLQKGGAISCLYQEHPIPATTDRIRLLVIDEIERESGGDGAVKALKTRFETYNVHEAPQFVALSYTWGPEVYVQNVFCISVYSIPLRSALWDALRHIYQGPRNKAEASGDHTENVESVVDDRQSRLLIWIDSLCIDQSNIHERNHQVTKMPFIYKNAVAVLAYTGNEADRSTEVLMYWQQFLGSDSWSWRSRQPQDSQRLGELSIAWCTFFNRVYWSRLWIVQECFLAKRLYIYAGHAFILLLPANSRNTTEARNSLVLHKDAPLPGYDLIIAKEAYREVRNTQGDYPNDHNDYWMAEIFPTWSTQECSDRRDKVYGLIGLSKNSKDWPIPDYFKSVEEVFIDTVMCFVPHWIGGYSDLQRVARDLAQTLDVNLQSKTVRVGVKKVQEYFDEKWGDQGEDSDDGQINILPTRASRKWWTQGSD